MKAFDSSAWIEYFRGSAVGEKVKEIVEGQEVLSTPSICLAEIKVKYLTAGQDPEERLQCIKSRTSIVDVDATVAETAAELKVNHRLHMVDALVLACARSLDAELVTGDRHFRGMPGISMLEP